MKQRLFNIPSTTKPRADRMPSDIKALRPLGDSHAHPSALENNIVPRIIRLLNRVRPSAVFWAVVSIVVDPVDAGTFWSCAHVAGEYREAILPPFADLDSSSSITWESGMLGIGCSGLHPLPSGVKRVIFGFQTINQFCARLGAFGISITSAGHRFSVSDVPDVNGMSFSAVAGTREECPCVTCGVFPFFKSHNNKSSEPASCFNVTDLHQGYGLT
jgi:hypothetical protein